MDEDEEETNLEAAVRWNNRKVIAFYLEHVKWPLELLEKILKGTKSENVKKEIKNKIGIHSGQYCCSCSLFSCIPKKNRVANAP